MTVREAERFIREGLHDIYDVGEAAAISDRVIGHLTRSSREERATIRSEQLSAEQQRQLRQYMDRLLQHEPVQYVLNEAWFCGLKLYVDKNVLIPRPETEELVDLITRSLRFPFESLSVFDIGTGSGCIAIALKRKFRKANVWACDISERALQVARRNATALNLEIRFIRMDMLDKRLWKQLPGFEIIVSNPPYVPAAERGQLAPNVLQYEPATALFVPDEDPLVHYRAILDFALQHLAADGSVYLELHDNTAKDVAELFRSGGFAAELIRDMQGKERMLKAVREKR